MPLDFATPYRPLRSTIKHPDSTSQSRQFMTLRVVISGGVIEKIMNNLYNESALENWWNEAAKQRITGAHRISTLNLWQLLSRENLQSPRKYLASEFIKSHTYNLVITYRQTHYILGRALESSIDCNDSRRVVREDCFRVLKLYTPFY